MLSAKCLIKNLLLLSSTAIFIIALSGEVKAAPQVPFILPDPMVFVQSIEAQAFEHLGQIMVILVSLIGVKWLLEALKGSS